MRFGYTKKGIRRNAHSQRVNQEKGSKWCPSASPEENLEQIHPSWPSEETNPASTLNFQTWEKIKLCSLSHQFIVFCYGSSRKLIQTRWKIPKLFIWGKKEDIASCVDKWLYLWKNHFIYHQGQFKTLLYSY